MTEFLIYQGKAAIALAVFYMFYRLLLSKETFHRFNRIMLLGTAALSFVLPLCVITFKEVVVVPAMTASSETFTGDVAETVAMVPEVSEPIWSVILFTLFTLGALAVLIHVASSIVGIRRIIRNGSHETLENGETLIITETDTAPFSWMKYIVISREDYESGYSQILTHEKAHIALRHSWDIIFVDMITALQWFNPAIWMLKADLRALHEFEADDAVLRSGANIKEYQYLLIRKAVSKSGYSVANSFNHSTLKARITMMLNKKSSRMSVWKALYVIPLVGISLAATAETKVDYRYEDQTPDNTELVEKYSTPVDKDTKKSFKEKNLKNGRITVDEEN
ncbi:MAG: M56 family metallopeptidase, partial [Bacteroidales bacterium]|nr:M56 family metallopeptidase [Bacteroidales bacterium]